MNHLIKKIIFVGKNDRLCINLMLLVAATSLPNAPVSFTNVTINYNVELFFLKTGKVLTVNFIVPRNWWGKNYANKETYARIDNIFYKLITLTFSEKLLTPATEGASAWNWNYGITSWGII